MKKVGIITFHNEKNYGAALQTYALFKTLEKYQKEVYVINYREKVENYFKELILGKNIKNNFLIVVKMGITNVIYFHKNYLRNRNFKKFFVDNIKLYGRYKNFNELKKNYPELDYYIAGSDQIWNANLTKGLREAYLLNYGPSNIIRASYAASIGTSEINSKYLDDYYKLNNLDFISVREEEGKKFLKKYVNKDISVVLDPTLLLKSEEWHSIIKERIIKEDYILVYDLEKNDLIYKIANYIAELKNIKIVNFRRKYDKNNKKIIRKFSSGPYEFLNLFCYANTIITNSFHGVAFSIIFNKQFFVVKHSSTYDRIDNLLKISGLTDRVISNMEELSNFKTKKDINYLNVNNKIEEEQNKAFEYLDKIFRGNENDKIK